MIDEPDRFPLDREMGPRSVIASLLLGMHPPRLSGARLVEFCRLFGITENAARVAMSRMVERGELVAGAGSYELAGDIRSIQTAQQQALAAADDAWDGYWRLAIVVDAARSAATRASFRMSARRAHLAELRPGVWGRPDNLIGPSAEAAWSAVGRHAGMWRAVPAPDESDRAVVRFALPSWADRARELVALVGDRTAALAGDATAIPPAFVAGAAALQHLRRDPMLPPSLLPPDWPGEALRAGYRSFQPEFARAVSAFFRAGPSGTVTGVSDPGRSAAASRRTR